MSDQPAARPIPPCDRVLDILNKGEINSEYGILRWSSNYAFLINIHWDNEDVTAVYKPQRGERPLWDFPDGSLCYREQASFLTSQLLGWAIVPPTVLREGPRGLGSMQYYIEHDPQINYFTFNETFAPQLQRIAAFDYLVNNADRKGGHCLLDSSGHIWGIDHGISFNAMHKLRTVIWDFAGQSVPDELLEDLDRVMQRLDEPNSAFSCALAELLSEQEIAAFRRRVVKMVKTRRYPMPGPGPNYPWPPV
ncbi:MAG: SCO1664 family protein [Chloroflexi bacterium]|nr:SCO1664 family protein [Chloroflexota bacterium]